MQGYIVRHRHKPKRNHFRGPGKKPPARATSAPAAAAAAPGGSGLPPGAYQGPFGVPQAVRLLSRTMKS